MSQIAIIIALLCTGIALISPVVTYWASRRPVNGEYRHVIRIEKECKALRESRLVS